MSKTKNNKADDLKHEQEYVEFLRKTVQSLHYRSNVTEDEFKKTKFKYDKAKLKLKMMNEV